jgi:predicted ATPase
MWAAVRESPKREIQLTSFAFSGIPGIQDGSMEFHSPITAICGVNGTGKSALLRGIWAALKWKEVEESPEIIARLRGFTAEIHAEIKGQPIVRTLPPDGALENDNLTIPLLHIDPSVVAASLQRRICNIINLDDVLEPHTPIRLSERDTLALSFILNKQYDHVDIYEIDDYQEEDLFSVAVVSESGVSYDSRTMSLGEMSVFTIFWALNHAEKGSLVLLEEPETYLSPVSQGALMDYIASVCVQKQITLIFTTHSPQMFARLTSDQVRFAYRTPNGATLAPIEQFEEMRRAVGLIPPIDRILLVEDRVAREFTRNLLRKLDHASLLRSEVIDVGGAGEITRICAGFPERISAFKFVGLYDGDSHGALAADRITWPAVFLPGNLPLEELFRAQIEEDPVQIAKRLGRDLDTMKVVLSRIRGLDHHDWFEEFGKALDISYAQTMHACFEQWIAEEYWQAHSENFLFDLRRMI